MSLPEENTVIQFLRNRLLRYSFYDKSNLAFNGHSPGEFKWVRAEGRNLYVYSWEIDRLNKVFITNQGAVE